MMVYTELINRILFNAGINTSSINTSTVKVFYKGIQIPIYFFGEQNGVFDDNDYFDFYGQRNYGGNTVTYKEANQTNVPDYTTNEYYNLYSDTSVYWAGWDGANGLRLTEYNYNSSVFYNQNYFFTQFILKKTKSILWVKDGTVEITDILKMKKYQVKDGIGGK